MVLSPARGWGGVLYPRPVPGGKPSSVLLSQCHPQLRTGDQIRPGWIHSDLHSIIISWVQSNFDKLITLKFCLRHNTTTHCGINQCHCDPKHQIQIMTRWGCATKWFIPSYTNYLPRNPRICHLPLSKAAVYLSRYSMARGPYLNSYPPGKNGHHFADNIFKCIFTNEKFCV